MNDLKARRKYVFSVEGETEKMYFEWLEKEINKHEKRKYNVIIQVKVEKSPRTFAKQINPISTEKVIHVCDYEGNSESDIKNFQTVLSELKEASKRIKYDLAYSNLTFELWIILHKISFHKTLSSKKEYLKLINDCFKDITKNKKGFQSLDEYKEQSNFKKCLSKLKIEDVIHAVNNAQTIMKMNQDSGKCYKKFKGYGFFVDNPSLNIGEHVALILKESGIL